MNVLLLAGGNSSERQVSLDSGAAILRALRALGHTVEAVDPALGMALIEGDHGLIPRDTAVRATKHDQLPVAAQEFRQLVLSDRRRSFDVVFLGLHGGAGENGTIQNLLDLAGLPYTGSGMAASAVAMDKALTKRLMISSGIPTPEFRHLKVNRHPVTPEVIDSLLESPGLPMIVKPNDSGSTVGLSKVMSSGELPEAIERCRVESASILVEAYVAGREMTVAVLDGEALPVVEIRPRSGLYDYEAKYTKGKTEYLAPAPIDQQTAAGMQAAAVRLYEVIGAAGLARVDFMLDSGDRFFCLELNTLPGMTELSLSPMAARAVGMSFEELVRRIVESAIREFKLK
ncbi:MAG: D-alanine--D-alanine ligase [candidate division Zixibacteria bacterium]|jgi:D-alanine-D-alanine ligase|nr:D-alanine--D-alanine ligase [candidate division Zixibacteria bacterium]